MTIYDIPLHDVTGLQILWLILVTVLWLGFFFLEGFDFGVGMLIPFLGRDEKERRVMVNTIGPHWDGNEVWLLTAGGAMFAAFPGWYATLFSALYLPLFLVLLGLILRGVAFEYRGKRPEPSWRARWDWAAAVGSFLPSLVLGVGFANFVKGLPVFAHTLPTGVQVPLFAGSFWGLFTPFSLLGGVLFVVLFLFHGSVFLALKTKGEIHERAKAFATRIGWGVVAVLAIFVVWGNLLPKLPGQVPALRTTAWVLGIVAVLAAAVGVLMVKAERDGWAFIATGLATVGLIAMIFAHLYPGLGFNNSTSLDVPLDVSTAASTQYTLTIMTWAAGILVPVVLLYQGWTYWVFRRRISTKNIPDEVEVTSV